MDKKNINEPLDEIAALLRKFNGGFLRGAQAALAKKIGVEPGTVSRWLRGDLAVGEENAIRLSAAFGITVPELHRLLYGAKSPGQINDALRENALRTEIAELTASCAEMRKAIMHLTMMVGKLKTRGEK